MIEKIKSLIIKYKEIITYVIFGVLTTLVNWATYTVLVHFTPLGNSLTGITVSNAVAWIFGVLFAFITNKIWVFESKSTEKLTVIKELVSFVLARGLTGILEIFGLPLLMKLGLDKTLFGIEGAIAKIIISVVVVILNYVFSKLIVFRNKKGKTD